jgi:hypothetical protein
MLKLVMKELKFSVFLVSKANSACPASVRNLTNLQK